MDRVIRCAVQGTVPSDFHCPMAPVHTSLVHSYAADDSDCGGHTVLSQNLGRSGT